jgi:hypothetical protein
MKTATLPAVRVTPELRELAESVLKEGESLSMFIEETVTKHALWRKEDEAFYARAALASRQLREGGKAYTAEETIASLRAQVQRAREKPKQPSPPPQQPAARAGLLHESLRSHHRPRGEGRF